jgi:acetoin utilization deacetylase AcuC-like enzyme
MTFAIYNHPELFATSKPIEDITFRGFSIPYFTLVSQKLAEKLSDYPSLPLRKAAYADFARVHTQEYLSKIALMADDQRVENPPKLSIECTGMEYCIPGYCYKLGGLMEAIDQMKNGRLQSAYILGSGGHHAYPDWGHGYCLLHPLATGVRYAQEQGFARVLIVDWDLHHGDGTQAIFAHDPTVYCISIHSAGDLYMALAAGIRHGTTTAAAEVGQCNIPILHALYDDGFADHMKLNGKFYRADESLTIFQQAVENLPWQPNLICIFSGYDSHKDDRGKDITNWSNEDYRTLTKMVLNIADQADCPVLSVHGGGYTLDVVVEAATHHIDELAKWATKKAKE